MKNTIFGLNAKNRLNLYRKRAADSITKNPNYTAAANWRYWKKAIFQTWPNNGRKEGGKMYTDDKEQFGVYIGDYSDIANIDNLGWYADNYQQETIKGGVVKLRCPKGTLYIPVTWTKAWDGSTHYLGDCEKVLKGAEESEHDEAIKAAANSANYYAEQEAEQAREHDAQYLAETDIENAREIIHVTNKKALSLIREIKKHGEFSPAVCKALREKLADYLSERAAAFEVISEREADYWTACPGY